MARRDMGKLMFLDLVDRSGRIQLLVRPDELGDVDLDLGDIVGVEGVPTKSRRGEPSLAVRSLELLAKIRAPLPDTFHGITDVEQRYRRRYLDLLMNEDSRRCSDARRASSREMRAYLDGEGFLEVETPILQPRYGGGFAEPFVTHSNELDADLYLRIADELYLKRLIVGGLEKVYELAEGLPQREHLVQALARVHAGRVVRGVRRLPRHDGAHRGARRARGARLDRDDEDDSSAATTSTSRRRGSACGSSRRSRTRASGRATPDELRAKLDEAGVDTGRDKTWTQLADHAYSHFVEPELIQPTIVYDWPIEMSPFARTTDDDETLVERFECVVGGMEFANAFSELNDSEEQAQRFAMQEAERAAGDVEAEPGDPDFVEALSYGMPPTGGCGVGIDRLAMVLTGSDTIRDVILFPALRARD